MSLCTDKFFFNAIRNTAEIVEEVGNEIYSTARGEAAERRDTVPYIIITNEGTTNGDWTKDCEGESDEDTDTIAVMVVANDRDALARLATKVRKAVKKQIVEVFDNIESVEDYDFFINGYTFSASEITMDVEKPCVWQTLTYVCATTNLEEDETETD